MEYQEIENKIYELMTKRGKRVKGDQKRLFLDYLKQLKGDYGILISTDYLRNLLIFKGFDPRKATFNVCKFIKNNNLTENLFKVNKDIAIKKYMPYGCCLSFDDIEVLDQDIYDDRSGFIPKIYKKELSFISNI